MPSLNLLVLRVPHPDKTAAFYGVVFGIQFREEQHGSGEIHYAGSLGSMVLEFYPVSADRASTTGARLGFAVRDVDATVARARGAGGHVVRTARETRWGYRATIDDPDGHRIDLSAASTSST